MPPPDSKNPQDFSLLEKEALKEISLDIIKSDLQKSLGELHQKSMADVTNRISTIEAKCVKEIQAGLEKNIQSQLEEHFQRMVQSYQGDISKVLSPLLKRAEGDVQNLNHAATQTQEFCQNIQNQYALRWSTPFLTLIFSTALAGALMGLVLFFLQVPLVSVFLMNKHTREAYGTGVSILNYRRELEAQPMPKATFVEKTPIVPKVSESPKNKKKGVK